MCTSVHQMGASDLCGQSISTQINQQIDWKHCNSFRTRNRKQRLKTKKINRTARGSRTSCLLFPKKIAHPSDYFCIPSAWSTDHPATLWVTAARKAVIERQARQLLGRLAPQLDLDFEAEVEDEPEEEEEAAKAEDEKEAAKAAQDAAETAVPAEAQSAPAAEGAATAADAVAQALDASAAASVVLSPGNEAAEGERREGEVGAESSAHSSDAAVAADSPSVVEAAAAAASSSLLPVVVVAAAAITSTGTGADTVLVAPRLKVQTVSAKQRRANASFPAAALSVAPGIAYVVFRCGFGDLGFGIWDLGFGIWSVWGFGGRD
jgi:hypothetical protein